MFQLTGPTYIEGSGSCPGFWKKTEYTTQLPFAYGAQSGTILSPFALVWKVKNDPKRQSRSCPGVRPFSQLPSPLVGGTSVETTVNVNGVSTCPIVNAAACAFGSRQGFPGVGFGFDGQSNATWPDTFVPGVNGSGSACGGGTKEAVTD